MIRLRISKGILYIFICLLSSSLLAQKPFDCNGRMFRVKGDIRDAEFQEILIEENPFRIQTPTLARFEKVHINGICYRPTDNLIYGVELSKEYRLIRIDANYELSILKTLPLPTDMTFVAGDVSPDGRYLVLLGYNDESFGNLLALVDLSVPSYPTQLVPLSTLGNTGSIYCADIAYHPTTGVLYGFDHRMGKLITIDLASKTIDNASFPISESLSGNVPSLFFDAYGRLFGIAYPDEESFSRSLYEFNPSTGEATFRYQLGQEDNQDACSCPYQVNLLNEVSNRKGFACTELTFKLTLINRSPFVQENLKIRDTFPSQMRIKAIKRNPFDSRVLSGIGTNVLAIDGIEMPIGEDSIEVVLEIPEGTTQGVFSNQAVLQNIQSKVSNDDSRVSDDPLTPAANDPTLFEVSELEITFAEDFPILCPGESLILDPGVDGAGSYFWNTGAPTSTLEVSKAGWYEIQVNTNCGRVSGGIYVDQDEVRIDFNDNIEVQEGEMVTLNPQIISDSPIKYFYWGDSDGSTDLGCLSCSQIEVQAVKGREFTLEVENENGCIASDAVNFDVQSFRFYAPNAFSPNGDGSNERFFLQGAADFKILQFQVFDRWGGIVFQIDQIQANDELSGWDGTNKGRMMDVGTYVWSAKIEMIGGQVQQKVGEFYLFR